MKMHKHIQALSLLLAILALTALNGCQQPADPADPVGDTTDPVVVSTTPINGAVGVAIINDPITAVFSEEMDPESFVGTTFTLYDGVAFVPGSVMYDVATLKAVFTPTGYLDAGNEYTATVTTGVTDVAGNSMVADKVWTFTTTVDIGNGLMPVNLGTAASFVVLAKTAVSTVPASVITGDVGISPAAESFMTGFSQPKATGYSTSPQVTGFMYAADSTPPTPANMTTAVSNMEAAYVDAAGRPLPDFVELHTGNLGGQTLAPGLYKYALSVTIPTNVTLAGGENDVWIFQIGEDLTVSDAVIMTLTGGAKAKNIFWQVAEVVDIGTTAHFEGNILCMTSITLKTNASMNGRALAQTLVALQQATITKPAQ